VLHTKVEDPELEAYHDLYNERLKELVEAKVAGHEVTSPPEAAPLPTVNYMDAIRASLQRRAKGASKRPVVKKGASKRAAPPKPRKTG
jgi:non-homologous end joining protein Ku